MATDTTQPAPAAAPAPAQEAAPPVMGSSLAEILGVAAPPDEAAAEPAAEPSAEGAEPTGEPAAEPAETPEQAEAREKEQRAEQRREKIRDVHREAQARRDRAKRQEARAEAMVQQAEAQLAELKRRADEVARFEQLLEQDPERWADEVARRRGKRGDDIFESWAKRRVNGGARDPGEVANELAEQLRAEREARETELKRMREEQDQRERERHVTAIRAAVDNSIASIANVRNHDEDRQKWPNVAAEPVGRVRSLAQQFYRHAAQNGMDVTSVQTAIQVANAVESYLADENAERLAALGVQRGPGNPGGARAAAPAGTGHQAQANPVAAPPRTITNARAASAGSVRRDLSPKEKAELGGQILLDSFPSLRSVG